MLKIAVIMLSTILIDTNSILFKKGQLVDNKKREKNYLDGLKKFSNFTKKYGFDTYLIDNSLKFEQLHPEIQKIIKDSNYIYYNNNKNSLGKINKGAGLIEAWHDNIDLISKYDYIIHYEPRLQMTEDCVIPVFLKNPGNYFKKRTRLQGVETGFFIVHSRVLLKYLIKSAEEIINMCTKQISIENDVNRFLLREKIKVNYIPKLGVDWLTFNNNVRKL